MSRDEILALVIRHVADTMDDLSAADIDPDRSLTELGLTSLDAVEVVTRSQRALQVKVPRSQLRKARTVNQLVDVLCHAAGTAK
jgi:acyl carrier protein